MIFAVFVRLTAILVGLTDLIVFARPIDAVSAFQAEAVGWNEVSPPALAVVVAGLITRR